MLSTEQINKLIGVARETQDMIVEHIKAVEAEEEATLKTIETYQAMKKTLLKGMFV